MLQCIYASFYFTGLRNCLEEHWQKNWGNCSSEENIWCLHQSHRCSANLQGNYVPPSECTV